MEYFERELKYCLMKLCLIQIRIGCSLVEDQYPALTTGVAMVGVVGVEYFVVDLAC